MAIDISDITLAGGSNTFTVTNSGNLWAFDSTGRQQLSNNAACQVGNNGVSWIYQTAGAWNTIAFTGGQTVTRQSIYSGNRFTAPVTGKYFLSGSTYTYYDTAAIDNYHRPLFSVNGNYAGPASRGGSVATPYRIRYYGRQGAGYHDLQIDDIKFLQVGDWVEFVTYSNRSTNRYYTGHTTFSIALIG